MALCLAAPVARERLARWIEEVEAGASLPPDVMPRPRPGAAEGRVAAQASFADWCRRALDAGSDASLDAHRELAERHPLADDAREALVREARAELPASRAARLRVISRAADRARTRFIEHNQGLIVRCAQSYLNRGLPLSDLVQEGNLGLLRAVERFDPALGYRFSTYAVWWIRHALGRAIDTQSRAIRLPVHAAEDYRLIRRARSRAELVGESDLSDQELARRAGVSLERVREFFSSPGQPVSYDAGQPGDLPLLERIADADAEDASVRTQQSCLLRRLQLALGRLDARERGMMQMRFGLSGCRPHTLAEVGLRYGVTRERARQILVGACRRLRAEAELRDSSVLD